MDKSLSPSVSFPSSITCCFSKTKPFHRKFKAFDAVLLSQVMERLMIHLFMYLDAFESPYQTVIFVDVPLASITVNKTVKIVKFGNQKKAV